MPREKRQFEDGELYHITLRRIADEPLFLDEDDYYRGVFSIYEFNNSNPVDITHRRRERAQFKKTIKTWEGLTLPDFGRVRPSQILTRSDFQQRVERHVEPHKRLKFVEVLCFVLMPNHLHLILRQLVQYGISKYMQKFGSGFAAYFFEKYYADIKKRGHFFQDRFNAVHIVDERQLQVALAYDWTNPIALIEPFFKENGIKDPDKAKEFLEKYKWSSYQDCIGIKNFPSIIEAEKDFLMEVMSGADGCRQAVNDWILHKGEIAKIAKDFPKLFLE